MIFFLSVNAGEFVLELFLSHRFTNPLSIVVFLLYVALVTMVVTVWWLLATCITLVISPLCVTLSVPPSLSILD